MDSIALLTLQDYAIRRLNASPVVAALRQRRLSRAQYRAYMDDVFTYAGHSSVVIGMAAARLVHSHPTLAEYLFRHANEELGHDEWASRDLIDLGRTRDEIAAIKPSSACLRMIGLEYFYAAHANPVGLFGWMFVLESLGGNVAGTLSTMLDKALGLGGKGTLFLRGHGDADAHHAADLSEVIARNVSGSHDRQAFERMAEESLELYCGILDHAYEAVDVADGVTRA